MVVLDFVAETCAGAGHAHSHGEASVCSALAIAGSAASGFVAAFSFAGGAGKAGGSLSGDDEIRRDGSEIKSLADEGTEGDDEVVGMDVSSFDKFLCGLSGEAHLFFRSEKDDIGEGGFDGIADPSGAVGAAAVFIRFRRGGIAGAGSPQIAEVGGINGEFAGEGAA